MKLSTRFTGSVILCVVATLGAGAWIILDQQQRNIHEQVLARAQNVLNFGEACREYTREVLSPAVHLRFDPPDGKAPLVFEADSATFAVRGTFQALRKRDPRYTLREAALNPLSNANRADDDERLLIERFRADGGLRELSGFRSREGREEFYVARPIQVTRVCMDCHRSPDTAPREVVQQYGREHGYGWQEGEVNSALIVAVPTEDIRAQQAGIRWKLLGVFLGLGLLLGVAIPVLFERLVNRRLKRAALVMEQVAG